MAKKIRFPLEMGNGVEVRSLEELRENFRIDKVLEYIRNGKLITWLRDRYESSLAEEISKLDPDDVELAKKVSAIFDVELDDEMQKSLEMDSGRALKLEKLKKYTDSEKYIDVIDQIAFNQDELYDMLDEDVDKIYLCGDRFSIPLSKQDISYTGINNPVVVISSKEPVDWERNRIQITGVVFDEKYQAVIEKEKSLKNELRQQIPAHFNMVKQMLEECRFDPDLENKKKIDLVHDNQIVGMHSK